MATVQNDQGNVDGADTLATVEFFRAYHTARGRDYSATIDATIEAAGVIATDYMGSRWSYVGETKTDDQTTPFPRWNADDVNGRSIDGIPMPVKQAWAEYTAIQLAGDLETAPTRDDSGARVIQISERVGPVSEAKTFASGAAYQRPVYPVPDGILKRNGYVVSGGTIIRG